MSIQRQETGMLALCAKILFWVSVSQDKEPGALKFGTLRKMVKLGALGAMPMFGHCEIFTF